MSQTTTCQHPVLRPATALLLLALSTGHAAAQDDPDENAQDDRGPGIELSEKFRLEGFVTAGFADADFLEFPGAPVGTEPLPTEAALGIPEDGTLEYGNFALRGRYDFTRRGTGVFQLSLRSFDDSPISDAADTVELDWAFYEHRFRDQTWLRAGRTPIPFGILNDKRDVGTELPFFRPAFAFYREGGLVSETVDGLLLHHRIGRKGRWGFEIDVYGGQWELLESQSVVNRANAIQLAELVETVDAEDGYGAALRFDTPISFALSAGLQRFTIRDGTTARLPGEDTDWEQEYISIDLDRPRTVFRFEFRQTRFPANFRAETLGLETFEGFTFPEVIRTDAVLDAFYLQAGHRFLERRQLGIFVQWERSSNRQESVLNSAPGLNKPHTERERLDFGLAVTWRFKNRLVLRAETHLFEAQSVSVTPIFVQFYDNGTPVGPFTADCVGCNSLLVLTRINPMNDGRYSILSVSYRF